MHMPRRRLLKVALLAAVPLLLLAVIFQIRKWQPRRMPTPQHINGASVYGLAFSPDGQLLAGATKDLQGLVVYLWNPHRRALVRTLPSRSSYRLHNVAFSPDGKTLAAQGVDNTYPTIRLWDVATGKVQRRLQIPAMGGTQSLAFSPDGTKLASGHEDGGLVVWDLGKKSNAPPTPLKNPLMKLAPGQIAGTIYSVAFAPDSRTIAAACATATIELWDARKGRLLRTLRGHTKMVQAVAFSPDGRFIVSGSNANVAIRGRSLTWSGKNGDTFMKRLDDAPNDYRVLVWDARTGKLLRALNGHKDGINSVAFSPDSTQIASASEDTTVRLWDVASGRTERVLKGHTRLVLSTAFSPDGKWLASGGYDYTTRLWRIR
jgi:WD40 repeat protein